ncbi:MAG: CotH kinase family protein [Bacilli bacterium]|nr:CotH kinase family protein [Bacilli bacterium]
MNILKFKKISLVILILVIIMILFTTYDLFLTIDIKKIKQTRQENNNFVVNIEIDGELGNFNKLDNIYYFVVNYHNIKKINIISPYKSNYVINKINPNEYEIFIYSDKYYQTKKIIFVDIPIINITSNIFVKNRNIDFRGNEELGQVLSGISIHDSNNQSYDMVYGSYRIRGGTSLEFPKKSYKIDLDKGASLLGMNSDSDWILDALYTDISKVRNKLSSDIWNLINDNQSINNDIEGEFVELFIDNEYQGLYVLKEKVDKEITNTSSKGLLLKSIFHVTDVTRNNFINNSLNIVNYNGEPVIENFEIKFFNKLAYSNFLAMMHNYYVNNKNYESVNSNFDIDNYINYKVFLMIVCGVDNVAKNQYYSMYDENSKILITPWDLDLTFGIDYSGTSTLKSKFVYDNYNDYIWILDNVMDNDFNDLIKERYFELRNNIITKDTIDSYLDSYKELLVNSGAAKRDSERWYNYNIEYEIENIRTWANNRMMFLDEYFKL